MARIGLKEAKIFHGHLGPYLIIGLLAGELALNKLGCKKYFGLEVKAWGANKKPKSCLIDGLQLSTGATYGKGNIKKIAFPRIKIEISNRRTQEKITLSLKENLTKELKKTKSHRAAEALAKKLYSTDIYEVFNLKLSN